jgi:hypothetical protein
MANRYGEAALIAVKMETYGKALSPLERWEHAVKQLYPTTPAGQKRGAPRATFLGLCEAGLVQGIPAQPVTLSTAGNRNKAYAVAAVQLLRSGEAKTVTQLWASVTAGEDAEHASQMDVVLALWKNNLIVRA